MSLLIVSILTQVGFSGEGEMSDIFAMYFSPKITETPQVPTCTQLSICCRACPLSSAIIQLNEIIVRSLVYRFMGFSIKGKLANSLREISVNAIQNNMTEWDELYNVNNLAP